MKPGPGAQGFSKEYWDENYAEAHSMDGVGNVDAHVGYLKNFFALEFVDISSVADFGFGLGHLFEAVMKEFMPYRALGIEPSEHAFCEVKNRGISPVESTKLTLKKIDLVSWCREQTPKTRWFDLGLCTSVLQYLSDEECEFVLEVMSRKVKYMYFSVPTDKELARQVEEVEFFDRYAIRRSRSKYLKMIRPHFTFVGARILESKFHFNESDTALTDLLFRF